MNRHIRLLPAPAILIAICLGPQPAAAADLKDEAVPVLAGMLKNPDAQTRIAAIKALADIGTERAVEALAGALNDPDPGVSRTAASSLSRLGGRVVGPLAKAIKTGDVKFRLAAIDVLAATNAPDAAAPLAELLKESDVKVREAAARGLTRLPDPPVEPLAGLLNDEDPRVRLAAVQALAPSRPRVQDRDKAITALSKALADEHLPVRKAATDGLARLGRAAVPALIKAASDRNVDVRLAAVNGLSGYSTSAALEALRNLTADRSEEVRDAALRAVGSAADRRALEPLLEALENGRRSRSWEAARILGEMKDPRSVGPLIKALAEGDDATRSAAASALGVIGDARAVAPLRQALRDTSQQVRHSAAGALAAMPAASPAALAEALASDEAHIRDIVIKALCQRGTEEVAPVLIQAIQRGSTNADQKRFIIPALARVASADAVTTLLTLSADQDAAVRSAATDALGAAGDSRAVRPLLKAWQTETHRDVQVVLITALLRLGDSAALKAVLTDLARTDPPKVALPPEFLARVVRELSPDDQLEMLKSNNAKLCVAAIEQIGRRGDQRALVEMTRLIKDSRPEVQSASIAALGQLAAPRSADVLVGLLQDPKAPVADAAFALARLRDERCIEPLRAIALDRNRSYPIRSRATAAIGFVNSPAAREALARILESEAANAPSFAAHALEACGDEKSAAALMVMIRKGGDVRQVAAAIQAVGAVGSRQTRLAAYRELCALPLAHAALGESNRSYGQRATLGSWLSGAVAPDVRAIAAAIERKAIRAQQAWEMAVDWEGMEDLVGPLSDLAVKSGSGDVCCFAVSALGAIGSPKAIPALLAALNRRGPLLMNDFETSALARIPDPRSVQPLIDAITRVEQTVATQPERALFLRGEQYRLIRALSVIRDKRAADHLATLLESPQPDLRQLAIRGLAEQADPRVLPALRRHVQGGQTVIPGGDPLLMIGRIGGQEGVDFLFELINESDLRSTPMGGPAARAASALVSSGNEQAFQRVLDMANGPDQALQRIAALGLTASSDPRAVDLILPLLGDRDYLVRMRVLEWLAANKPAKAGDALLARLPTAQGEERERIITALGRISDPRATPALVRELRGRSKAAATALGALGGKQAVDALIIASRDDSLRAAAIVSLGRLNDPQAIPTLWKAAGDGSAAVRLPALLALARQGQPGVRQPLIDCLWASSGRRALAIALAAADGASVGDALIAIASKAANNRARIEAIQMLPQMGDPKAIDVPVKPAT